MIRFVKFLLELDSIKLIQPKLISLIHNVTLENEVFIAKCAIKRLVVRMRHSKAIRVIKQVSNYSNYSS